jgi:DNA-binding CsgD family transcriptional regulator/tetratricopeptide (TPR) repeat protein
MSRPHRPTVGREQELARLDVLVERARSGLGSVSIIEGEPGIGKSQLVAELLERAGAAGLPTLVGYGEALDRSRPLHVFGRLFDDPVPTGDGSSERAGLEPLLSGRHLLQEATIAAVERRALEPLVLIAEDVHWADDASLVTLIEIVRMSETMPILAVLTCRRHPDERSLRRLLDVARRRDHEWLRLDPLEHDEVRELAATEVPSDQVERFGDSLDAAAGNPFLVLELVRTWSELERGDRLRVAVDRISHLHDIDDRVAACLRAASVLGTRFELQTLSAVLEMPLEQVEQFLDEAARAGLVSFTDDGVIFRHDLVRDALYTDIASEVRAAHHRRAAAVMLQRDASPVEAAEHVMLGARDGDSDAVTALARAARALVAVDPARSIELLDRADEIDPSGGRSWDAARASRLETRIRGLAAVGRLEAALETGRGVTALGADAAGRGDLAEALAGLAVLGNRPTDALSELGLALESSNDPRRTALLEAETSLVLMTAGDIAGGLRAARSAARAATELGELVARSLALSVEGRLVTFDHGYEAGRELGRQAVAVAELDATGEAHRWLPWFFLGLTELDLDDLDGVDAALQGGRLAARLTRTPWAEPLYTSLAASAALRRGDLDDAMSLAESAVDISHSFESIQALAWAHATAALAAFEAGDVDAARDHVTAATDASASGSMLGADHVVRAQALVAESDGEHAAAFDLLDGAWRVFEAAGVASCQPVLAPDLTRLAIATGRTDVAGEVAESMDAIASRVGVPWMRACSDRCAGLATGTPELLRRAVKTYRSTPRRLDLAAALGELALTEPYDRDDLGREVREIRSACGIATTTETNDQRSRSASGWERLTATERAIADLVCEGLTNSDIADRRGVSRRTVESHLARVYRKLGVRTRSQLVVAALQGPPR